MSNMWSRVVESWHVAQLKMAERVARGEQPEYHAYEITTVGLVFYFVVLALLYSWMSGRKEPLGGLKPFIAFYNVTCVLLAGYVFVGIVWYKIEHHGSFVCNDGGMGTESGKRMGWLIYVFFLQKFYEFTDTFLFILRKSFRQVSFLHVYHHASITLVTATFIFDYAGDFYLPALLNSFVHVLMYSHYFVTSLGYKSWWNKYLTSLQLIQFVLIAAQFTTSLYLGPECGPPDFSKVMMIFYMGSMLVLFGNFFLNRYSAPKEEKPKKN